MYKIRKTNNDIELFDGFQYYNRVNLSQTSWEIIQTIKKYGEEKATQKIMKLYQINEKNAKEDIQTVLTNLKTLKININEIPTTVSRVKYTPRTVHFDVTPRCNSNCVYCIASDRMKDPTELTTKQVINVIDQLPALGTWLLTLSGGEPLLRKDIFQILDRIEKLELLTQIFTNGTLITKEFAERFSKYRYAFIQVSLDSCIPEHHEANRGVKGIYKKTLQGIHNLLEYGVTPEICIVLTRETYKDLEKTSAFLHTLGIKYIRLGPAHPYSGKGYDNRNNLDLTIDKWKEIGEKIINLNKKYAGEMEFYPTRHFVVYTVDPPKEKLHRCGNGRTVLFISPNGLVYPCIFMVYPQFVIGDVKKDKLADIWKKSSLIKKIRYFNKENVEKCRNCDVKHLCSGGCRSSSYYHHESIFEYDPYFCALFNKK
jgi:radical SAM protein with 4Fe4S-binding SPASM domain